MHWWIPTPNGRFGLGSRARLASGEVEGRLAGVAVGSSNFGRMAPLIPTARLDIKTRKLPNPGKSNRAIAKKVGCDDCRKAFGLVVHQGGLIKR
jgi:hypothetical protein